MKSCSCFFLLRSPVDEVPPSFPSSPPSPPKVVLFLVGLGGYRIFNFPITYKLENWEVDPEFETDFRWKRVLSQHDFNALLYDYPFKTLLIYADFEESASFFLDGAPSNVVGVTVPTNYVTHCFSSYQPYFCRSNDFTAAVITTSHSTAGAAPPTTLKQQAAKLQEQFEGLVVHNLESGWEIYNGALPQGAYASAGVPPVGAEYFVGSSCRATEVGVLYCWTKNYRLNAKRSSRGFSCKFPR